MLLAAPPIGNVKTPYNGTYAGTGGLGMFIGNLFKVAILGAALYALVNFLMAGYSFLSAGGDPKKIESSWAKIWQSILGLALAAGSFTIGAMVSKILFGDPTRIFNITVTGPS